MSKEENDGCFDGLLLFIMGMMLVAIWIIIFRMEKIEVQVSDLREQVKAKED